MFGKLQQMVRRRSVDPLDGGAGAKAPAPEFNVAPASSAQRVRLQQAVLENASNAVVITDAKGTILWTNPAFTVLTGYPAAEAIGQNPRLLKSGRHGHDCYRELWQTILAGQTWRREMTNRRKDGTLYQGEQVITPVRGDDGVITHFVAVMNDLTARRQAEAAERAAHQHLQHVLDCSPVASYGAKWRNGEIVPTLVSERFRRMLGLAAGEAIPFDGWRERLHPDDRRRALAGINETLTHNVSVTEYRLRHADGTYRWFEDHCRLVRDASGEPDEFIGAFADITARKQAEEVLRAAAVKHSGRRRTQIKWELAALVLGMGVIFTAGQAFGWFEWIFALAADEARYPYGDEIVGVIAILLPCLVVFSYRRWRESEAEAVSQQSIAESLRTLHAELEARIQQRTSELARANDELRAEVAERRRAENALEQERLLVRAVIDQIPDLVYLKDRDSRFLLTNVALARQLGVASPAELLGKSDADFHPADRAAGFRADEVSVLAGQPLIDKEEMASDGSGRVFLTTKLPHRDRSGAVTGVVGVGREITRRKRTEEALRQSEERLRLITETIDDVFWMANVESTEMAYVSSAYERVWGRSLQSLRENPRSFLEAVHPADRPRVLASFEAQKTGKAFAHEYRIVRPSGAVRWIRDSGFPVRGDQRRTSHYVGVAQDITERKLVEDELKESERRFRDMLSNVELIAMTLDTRGHLTFCNDYLLQLTGWRREEAIGASWMTEFLPESAAPVRAMFFATIEKGEIPRHYENQIKTRTGERRDIAWNNTVLRDAAGAIVGTASIGEDVTDRKRAAAALQQAKDQYQSIYQQAIEGFYQTTPEGVFRAANPAMARILGFASPEELMAERRDIGAQGYVDPARREEFKALIERQGFVGSFEYEVYRKDGSRVWVSENARAVHHPDGRVVAYEGTMADVTERKQAELRLKLQHAVTQVLAEGASLEQTSRKILATLGLNQEWHFGEFWRLDRPSRSLRCAETWHVAAQELEEFAAASQRMESAPGTGLVGHVWTSGRALASPDLGQDGECLRREAALQAGLRGWVGFPISLRNETLGVVSFFSRRVRDVDEKLLSMLTGLGAQIGQFIERQELAELFREAQKMEAIGTLAGGIAHDFNNIIAGIVGYTELAKMELGRSHAVTDHLNCVLQGSSRATALVRQILAFSRQQEHERKPMQLRHVVHEALALLRASIPSSIEFAINLNPQVAPVMADATQVHQVVMNLCTNAWHAMKERPGRLAVELEPWQATPELAEIHPGLKAGPYARLTISDTGHGMDAATLGRIFEPFYTTKGPGEGTGLGLAVVHGIMQTHEGAVTVYSQPGEGTVFRLYFPSCVAEATESPVGEAMVPRGAGELVLFVDDEEPLAIMGRKVLERLGYRVEGCTDAERALECVRARPARYDLVITDLTMPSLSGTDLARELLAIRADLPIILTTGFAATLTAGRIQAMGIRELLLKPLSMQALGAAVHRVLVEAKRR